MVVEDRAVQHLLGSAAALGLGVVAPCVLPAGMLAGAAGAIGGLASNLLANILQKHLDKREKDPTLPDINHDLLRVVADGVAHEIAEYARENSDALGEQRRPVEKLAKGAGMAYTALFVSNRLPGVTPPDPLTLLEAAARDGEIPQVGDVAEWESVVRSLSAQAAVVLDAEVEVELARWLHAHVWESIRKALKRDFAHDGRGYAALHLSFMGELMARVDALAQQPKEQQEAMRLTRELIEALRLQNQMRARPKGETIIEKLSERDRTRLGRLTQRFEQLSASIDRHFEELLNEVREADRGSRRRDAVTHERLAWTLCGIAIVGMIVTGTFLLLRDRQIEQGATTDGIARSTDQLGRSVGDVGDRIGRMDEKVDRLVSNLLVNDQQVEALRAQLESMVRSLATAEAAGDAEAKKGLDELEAGNMKVVADWLDEQIASRQQAVNYLLNQRTVMDLLQISQSGTAAQAESDLDRIAQRLEGVLLTTPNDFDANNLMGVVHMFRNEPAAARKRFQLLLVLAGSDQKRRATGLRNLATLEANSGNYEDAIKLYRDELGVHRQLRDRQGEAASLTDIGRLEQKLHRHSDAEANFAEALEIYRELKMPLMQSVSLSNLAETKVDLKNDDAAEQFYLQAYEIEATSGTLDYQASVLARLGSLNMRQGDLDAAETYIGKALEANRQAGDKKNQAADIEQLASIARKRGDLPKAEELYTQARTMYREVEATEDEIYAIRGLATVARSRNDLLAAQGYAQEALKLGQALNRLDLQLVDLEELIDLEQKQGTTAAVAHLQSQWTAADTRLQWLDQADALAKQGFAAERNGDLREASRLWAEARELFKRGEMQKQAEQMQDWIDWAAEKQRLPI